MAELEQTPPGTQDKSDQSGSSLGSSLNSSATGGAPAAATGAGTTLARGQVIRDRYRIESALRTHGQAHTYLARDSSSDRQVVVKVLPLAGVRDIHTQERFERQRAVLAGLDHPGIPKVLDRFDADLASGPSLCLVKSYVPGEDLATAVRGGRRFSETQARDLALQLADLLKYLHDLKPAVVHRDIKPSNLVLDGAGKVHLVDFAAIDDRPGGDLPGGELVGSHGYVPPEQLAGQAVPASDVYGLGATLLYLLSHTEPAELRSSDGSRIDFAGHVNVSPEFAAVLSRMVDQEPARRFASGAELHAALKESRPAESPVSHYIERGREARVMAAAAASSVAATGAKKGTLKKVVIVAGVVVGVITVAVLGVVGAIVSLIGKLFGN